MPDAPEPVRTPSKGALAMNAALLLLLAGLTVTNSIAQPEPGTRLPSRARGDYTMVSGKSNIGGGTIAYVVDGANQEIVALKWDQSKQQLQGIGYRSLGGDSRTSAPVR